MQQGALIRILGPFKVDACRVTETGIQDLTFFIILRKPDQILFSGCTLGVSGDPILSGHDQSGLRITLSMRAERAILDWIPVKSRFCAVCLGGSAIFHSDRLSPRCFKSCLCMKPSFKTPRGERRVLRELSQLPSNVFSKELVGVAGNFNAQLGYLAETRRHIESQFYVPVDRVDNGNNLVQFYFGHGRLLSDTSFCHKQRHQLTWCLRLHTVELGLITFLSVTGTVGQ